MQTQEFNQNLTELESRIKSISKEFGWNLENENVETHELIFKTRPSWLSWGESVKINLTQDKNKVGSVIVSVESNPEAQIFDWGKSRRNEELLINKLKGVEQ
ncbi:hypothetical protein M1384_04040 [Candidatus Parvarchaeota archaeon]|nr:hypothetical protein [Candidatus Parvarchaeota archaeon]MCL5976442.1 hypothetical protein [Candidatus Parvarchaeota archaeon]